MPVTNERRQLTPDEIKQLEAYSAIRVPMDQIAAMFGMSDVWLTQLIKDSEAAQLALAQGRAKASVKVRKTLFDMATEKGGEFQAMKFWCETQEGFKRTDVLELTGKDGKPLTSTAEVDEKLKQLFEKYGPGAPQS